MAEERSLVTTGSPVTGGQTSLAQDEITTSLLNRNSLQLTNLSRTVTNLSGQMTVLSNSLQSVGRNLATTQSLERQKEQQEQSLENKLAQQQLREGKESIIEKKIQASAIAPAQKLSGQAQFTLGRLQSFFVTLLGGWLVDKGIDTINALPSGNREELEKIKVQTLTGLGVITGIFVAAKLVIAKMIASFSLLGIGLTGLAIAGLFTTPGQQLLQFLVGAGVNAVQGVQDWWNDNVGGGNKSPNENLNLPDDDTDNVKRPDVNIDDISDNEAPPMKEGGLVMGKSHSEGGENKNLEGGEYVIRKPAVEAFGTDLMDTINSIDARGAQQALMDQFGLVDRVNEVGTEQALQEFRMFKMRQQLNMLAPYADIERQITENGERVTKSVSAMIQNGEIVKQKPDVSSGDVELPENLQTISADYTNDRTNTNVDRSLDATLAREDALLNLALQKNNEAEISPVPKKESTVSDVISQSTDTSAPVIIMSKDSNSAAPSPQQAPVSQGSVGGVPSFPSKNTSDMYILTTLSLLNVVV